MKNTSRYCTIFLLAMVVLLVSDSTAHAWTGPTQSPPSGNTTAPLNVGTSDQVKSAGLSVNALAVFGNAILSGTTNYLNFGTTAGSGGYGLRNNSGTLEFKNNGGSWTSITSLSGIGGSGTANYLPKFTAASTLGNSLIVDDGTNVGIGDATPASLLTVGNGDLFQVNSSGLVLAPDGSVTTPAYGFKSNTDMGFYYGGNTIYTAVNGVAVTQANGNGFNILSGGIAGNSTTGSLTIAGGNVYNNGTNIILYGGSHASAGNILFRNNTTVTGTYTAAGGWRLGDGSAAVPTYSFSSDTNTGVYSGGADTLGFSTGGTSRVTIDSSGNVGVGTTPGQKLDVNGAVQASSFLYSSDARLKKNIEALPDPQRILSIQPKTFTWKSDDTGDIGVIAQDVERVFPEFVHENTQGVKSVDYAKLIVPLLGVVRDQQEQIDALTKRIEALEQN